MKATAEEENEFKNNLAAQIRNLQMEMAKMKEDVEVSET